MGGAGAGVRGPAARGRGEDRRSLIIHVKDCVCIESLFQYKDNLIRSWILYPTSEGPRILEICHKYVNSTDDFFPVYRSGPWGPESSSQWLEMTFKVKVQQCSDIKRKHWKWIGLPSGKDKHVLLKVSVKIQSKCTFMYNVAVNTKLRWNKVLHK